MRPEASGTVSTTACTLGAIVRAGDAPEIHVLQQALDDSQAAEQTAWLCSAVSWFTSREFDTLLQANVREYAELA